MTYLNDTYPIIITDYDFNELEKNMRFVTQKQGHLSDKSKYNIKIIRESRQNFNIFNLIDPTFACTYKGNFHHNQKMTTVFRQNTSILHKPQI